MWVCSVCGLSIASIYQITHDSGRSLASINMKIAWTCYIWHLNLYSLADKTKNDVLFPSRWLVPNLVVISSAFPKWPVFFSCKSFLAYRGNFQEIYWTCSDENVHFAWETIPPVHFFAPLLDLLQRFPLVLSPTGVSRTVKHRLLSVCSCEL